MKQSAFDVNHQTNGVEGKIVAALERVSQAFRVMLWNESKTFSLSPIQVQVLIFLQYHSAEKRKVSYLADEFNMTKATISDTVKSLEQKQLIKKEWEPNDSRSYIIQLTKKGKDIASKTALFAEELQVPVENLHADDKESLLLSLLGIIHHLNKAGIITVQRMCSNCAHYRQDARGHFCKLLNQQLAPTALRIDCPEHLQAV